LNLEITYFISSLNLIIKYNTGNKSKKAHQNGWVNCPVFAANIAKIDQSNGKNIKRIYIGNTPGKKDLR
jgi:hypothetical protein